MTGGILRFRDLDPEAIEVLLCDADGNLFGSEEPAFVASTAVTNRFLADHGIEREFTPDELRRGAVGRNFRSVAGDLAAEAGASIDAEELESWVLEEQRAVVAHLESTLRPDEEVSAPLRELAGRFRLAVVSSSAHARLDACFRATGLDELLPHAIRFSAEDSLPVPTSKPDPAIYTFAGERLGIGTGAGLAVEDAAAGALSAVAAGFPTVGNLQFVPEDERERRIVELRDAGVAAIVHSWWDVAALLGVDRACGRLART
ncbi:MAG TPA: HAD family hydrolase [Thermoleophilaceae bacterium]|jgi:beta-phosphoglucomutase-like phosphatase (HAD superfamily)